MVPVKGQPSCVCVSVCVCVCGHGDGHSGCSVDVSAHLGLLLGCVCVCVCVCARARSLVSSSLLPGGSDSEESACNAGDLGLIPESGRSPGEENGSPLQDSRLENPMDREAWWATAHGVTKSWARLSH